MSGHPTAFDPSQALLVDHAPGGIIQRGMHRYNIREGHYFRFGNHLNCVGVDKILIGYNVIGNNCHVKTLRPFDHQFSNAANTDDALNFAVHIKGWFPRPAALPNNPIQSGNFFQYRQHQSDGRIRNRIRIGPRVVGNHDAVYK